MILKPNPRNIRKSAALIRASGVVAFPTETVYGLGANAFDPPAVEKIFRIKERPHYDPLIVHIADPGMLPLVVRFTRRTLRLTGLLSRAFWPGPLTLVLDKSPLIPGLVTAGRQTVAVRIPCHPVALKFLRACGVPVAAPSANRFGGTSPTTVKHVGARLAGRIGTILDGGPCAVGVESTIVDLTGRRPAILRPGGIAKEKIEKALGLRLTAGRRIGTGPKAPGQLKSHYAPSTPLILLDSHAFQKRCGAAAAEGKSRTGFVPFAGGRNAPARSGRKIVIRCLTQNGDPAEACRNLYKILHELDSMNLRLICVEKPPSRGLGLAVLDRLTRASRKKPR